MRVFWTGSISFGLVNIPIKLYMATKPREIHFHQLHRTDAGRVRYRMVCEVCGKELSREDIVKGFEYAKGHYTTFEEEELDAIADPATRTIDILDFVRLSELDPILYEKAYYAAPQPGAAKAYHLLREAMARTGRVALATFVLRAKTHLAVVRFLEQVLVLETLFFGDEVIPPADVPVEPATPTEREVSLALSLVEQLSVPFEARKYEDTYRQRLEEAIARKVEGHVVITAPSPQRAQIIDLMEALEASLQKTGAGMAFEAAIPESPAPPRKRRKA